MFYRRTSPKRTAFRVRRHAGPHKADHAWHINSLSPVRLHSGNRSPLPPRCGDRNAHPGQTAWCADHQNALLRPVVKTSNPLPNRQHHAEHIPRLSRLPGLPQPFSFTGFRKCRHRGSAPIPGGRTPSVAAEASVSQENGRRSFRANAATLATLFDKACKGERGYPACCVDAFKKCV